VTFSIVARCHRTGQLGVGALTAMAGVGKLVSHARPGAGALVRRADGRVQELQDSIEQPTRSLAQSGRRAENRSRPGCSS
jgi:hypothetical protein